MSHLSDSPPGNVSQVLRTFDSAQSARRCTMPSAFIKLSIGTSHRYQFDSRMCQEGLDSGLTAAAAHGAHDSPENRVILLLSCSIPSIGKLQAVDHPRSRMRVNNMQPSSRDFQQAAPLRPSCSGTTIDESGDLAFIGCTSTKRHTLRPLFGYSG